MCIFAEYITTKNNKKKNDINNGKETTSRR